MTDIKYLHFVCKKCKGMFFNINNVQRIKWGNYYLCHDCLDTEIYLCNRCHRAIRFNEIREDAKMPYCKHCTECICACCGDILHDRFPEDFPDNFKFCCGCHIILEVIVVENCILGAGREERKLAKKLSNICCGTIGVWENKNVILEQ